MCLCGKDGDGKLDGDGGKTRYSNARFATLYFTVTMVNDGGDYPTSLIQIHVVLLL